MKKRRYRYLAIACLDNGTWREQQGVFDLVTRAGKAAPGAVPKAAAQAVRAANRQLGQYVEHTLVLKVYSRGRAQEVEE
jgi:hypothetical protein